jgi:cell fate regulator YaaT (PSP1 superfamily)
MNTEGVTLTKVEFISLIAKNVAIPLAERIKLVQKNPDFTAKEAGELIAEMKK